MRLCHSHCHMWVRYFDTTKIMVWFMSSILIHLTYFSVYTIWISEHYRVTVSYSQTSGQQVSAILWNITITVWLQSQVHRVTYFFYNAWHFYIKKYRNTYTVIILLYQACSFELQVVSRYYPIGSAFCTVPSYFQVNNTTYQKVSAWFWKYSYYC